MSQHHLPPWTRNPVLWGAYLACSWTWCIGMFLPALLLRDMGWSGFFIFAIPNVIGAAAMGWIIPTRVRSEEFVKNHATAIWWFSSITLAFHLFWIVWIFNFIQKAFQLPLPYLFGVAGIVTGFVLLLGRASRSNRTPQVAITLLALSLGILIATFYAPDLNEANTVLLESAPRSFAPLWMLPVMLFGFLLCPYLDITFHHARQQLDHPRRSRIGFSLGFVGFFIFMIFLTTRYSGVLINALQGKSTALASGISAGILIHILCQWLFTVRVHLNQIRTLPTASSKQPILGVLILFAAGIGGVASHLPSHSGLSAGEIIYRIFLGAYGLLFPTYMLYRVIIKSDTPPAAMWITLALAFPLFWLGFIEHHPIMLFPGIGLVLAGALLLQLKSKRIR